MSGAWAWVLLGGATALAAAACADADVDDGTLPSAPRPDGDADAGAVTDGGDAAQDGKDGAPPDAPPSYVLSRGLLGETDPQGNAGADAWRGYGFDLDGLTTDATSTDVCQRYGGAPPEVQEDGDNGIDNSFGRNVLPILMSVNQAPSAAWTAELHNGRGTLLFHVPALKPTSSGKLPGAVYLSADVGEALAYDGTDVLPIDDASLVDGNVEAPRTEAPAALISGGRWMTGDVGDVVIGIPVLSGTLRMTLHHARFEMRFDPDLGGATQGIVGGILDTEEFVGQVRTMIGSVDPSYCEGPTLEAILEQVRQSSDILLDGSQDPAFQCTGISVGLGFDAERVLLGDAVSVPVPPSPCP